MKRKQFTPILIIDNKLFTLYICLEFTIKVIWRVGALSFKKNILNIYYLPNIVFIFNLSYLLIDKLIIKIIITIMTYECQILNE